MCHIHSNHQVVIESGHWEGPALVSVRSIFGIEEKRVYTMEDLKATYYMHSEVCQNKDVYVS